MNLSKYAALTFFSGLEPADLEVIMPYFTSITYVAGTRIFEQGESADKLYIVAEGEIIIRYKPDDGPLMTVTHVGPGDVFGWSATMGNRVYTSGAICSHDSEILYIKGTDLRMLCTQFPKIGDILLSKVSLIIADRQKKQLNKVSQQ